MDDTAAAPAHPIVVPLVRRVPATAVPRGAARADDASRGSAPADPLWRELVGQVLRSERVEHHRTLQQVAERAGVSPQYLSEVERGRKDPSSEMLESICGALGLRLSELLAESGRVLHCGSPVSRQLSPRASGNGSRSGGVVSLAA